VLEEAIYVIVLSSAKDSVKPALNLSVTQQITNRPTACVTGAGVGIDSVWEQEKLDARKIPAVGAAEAPASSARFVGRRARPRLSGGGTKISKWNRRTTLFPS
jgi:hypothetical protein